MPTLKVVNGTSTISLPYPGSIGDFSIFFTSRSQEALSGSGGTVYQFR